MNSIGYLSSKNPYLWRIGLFIVGLIVALLFQQGKNFIFLVPQLVILMLHTMYYSMQYSSIAGEYYNEHPEERQKFQLRGIANNKIKEWTYGETKEKFRYITNMIHFNEIMLIVILLVFIILGAI